MGQTNSVPSKSRCQNRNQSETEKSEDVTEIHKL